MTLPWMAAKIVLRPAAELRRHAGNARLHSAEQLEQIKASMLAFGFNNPLLVDEDGVLIAGHGRLEAALALGIAKVPVIVLRHLSASQKDALRLADNRIAENATWDQALLRDALAGLQEAGEIDFLAIGFSRDEISTILAAAEQAVAETESQDDATADEGASDGVNTDSADAVGSDAEDPADEAPEPPRAAVTRPGDLWLLGPHRLLCGDATDAATVARVMGGDRAALLVDQPAVRESARLHHRRRSRLGCADARRVLAPVRRHGRRRPGAGEPGPDPPRRRVAAVLAGLAGLDAQRRLAPVRALRLGPGSRPAGRLERPPGAVLRVHLPLQPHGAAGRTRSSPAAGPDTSTPKGRPAGEGRHGRRPGPMPARACRTRASPTTCCASPATRRAASRPSTRRCSRWRCRPSSWRRIPMPGAVVYEPFSGSGTTILAGQRTGRQVRAIELAPAYVDLAIARWRNLHPDIAGHAGRRRPRLRCRGSGAHAEGRPMQPDLHVTTLPVAALIPYAENARTHSDTQVAQIAASIAEFGFVNPVLVDAAGVLVAGHGRVLGAKRLGMAAVPAIRLQHLSEAQARALRLADNQIALNSGLGRGPARRRDRPHPR